MNGRTIFRWVVIAILPSFWRAAPLDAELIGGNFQISTTAGGRFPDAAFNSLNGKYLVVWGDYGSSPAQARGRFVTGAGAVSGNSFLISTGLTTYALFPNVAYNATDNEFFIVWIDGRSGGDVTWGQRADGNTGVLLGPNFQISTTTGINPAIAWSATSNTYLAVWRGAGLEIMGQRISNTGALLGANFNISNDAAFSGYPAVAWASNGNQFLVTWDWDIDNNGQIHGQRVDAATGALLGGQITITATNHEDRSTIAYDPANNRWFVQFNDKGTPGNSYDQSGQLVSTAGALVGGRIPIATSPDFEGDTILGGDVACLPALSRFFSSFATSTGMSDGMGGRELDASGNGVGPLLVLATGFDTSLNNAADTANNRFLTVWEHRDTESGPYHIMGQLFGASDLAAPGPVTNLAAAPGSRSLTLTWTNPVTADFTGTLIRYKLGSYPISVNDGFLVVDQSNTPGSNDSFVHNGLSGGTTYFYAAFAHDAHPNYAAAATITGVPGVTGDFDVDGDVDIIDFAHLQLCFSGDTLPYGPGCANADIDVDGDVDIADFNSFDACMRGANTPPGC